jgi:cell division protein ZapA
MMKKIEVQIMQQSLLLSCPEGGEDYLREAAARVDRAMTQIRDGGKVRLREQIAVQAAINLAFEMVKAAVAEKEAVQRAERAEATTAHALAQAEEARQLAQAVGGPELQAKCQALLERLDASLPTGQSVA